MNIKIKNHFWIFWFITTILLFHFIIVQPVQAKDEYAIKTGKSCIFCHQESTGGQLKTPGFAYIRNGYQYPIPKRILEKAESLQTTSHKIVRFIIGYFHLLAAIILFGAIFYIHIFVGPKKLQGGIPKGERLLGFSCMVILTITGIYLTWLRIDKWEQFFNNTFGLMLFIKIILFFVMLTIGITAITIIHRRMREEAKGLRISNDPNKITLKNLRQFDGTQGKPTYFVHENKIYDVTESPKWKEGRHFGKHTAGLDLTEALKGAPHDAEVFKNVKFIGEIKKEKVSSQNTHIAHKIFIKMAYINLVLIFLILVCISVWRWDFPLRLIPEKRYEVLVGEGCIGCHRLKTPGIYYDWSKSVHEKVGIDCYDCHKTDPEGDFFSKHHLKYDPTNVAIVVTPKICAGCHPKQAEQYNKSKHANTLQIIWKIDHWLNDGMNNAIERATGCYTCHGSVVDILDGQPISGTWPNVGVGRKNPDGTLGSCSSCHTRHRFSVIEARKPEACDQCHLGPDHPQIEIYNESKHGTIYHAEGDTWNWSPDDGHWKAGRDYRSPTCSVCHMSEAGEIKKTHDVTERLSWETQAPFTVRPEQFKPFPANTNWKTERNKMEKICLQCHSISWTKDHFSNLDTVVYNYNNIYYKPVKEAVDTLYNTGILSNESYFDEEIEWEFYELWHHEGRRARFGAAMMAPDYAWWHGFYEVKHRFNRLLEQVDSMRKNGKKHVYKNFPGKYQEE